MIALLRGAAFLLLTIVCACFATAAVFGIVCAIWAAITLSNGWLLLAIVPAAGAFIVGAAAAAACWDESIS